MTVDASLIFSSSDLPDGRLSCSVRARFSDSAAAAHARILLPFRPPMRAASFRICVAFGDEIINAVGHWLTAPEWLFCTSVRMKLSVVEVIPLIQIKQTQTGIRTVRDSSTGRVHS